MPYALRASRFLAYGPTETQRWLRWQAIRNSIITSRCGRYLSLNNVHNRETGAPCQLYPGTTRLSKALIGRHTCQKHNVAGSGV
ncbi:hypothetical protein CDEST_06872 [Colletotrichum destructivum]|uniref:Uncharacterized protein n=1 Tax=Colletotrichum destructivum TaxID=34406 RepID=A0AAX4IEK5_9PEZI|nr:hypothetical protein CDEST_06872 [Colletotrichum destructivum]